MMINKMLVNFYEKIKNNNIINFSILKIFFILNRISKRN